MRTKVHLCGIDTSKLPTMKHEQMKEKFKALQDGELHVREELVYHNLRLVLSLVGRFSYRGEHADDLFQVGCIGLLKAIDHFDLKHNVRFSTYAVPMILGEIRRFLRDHQSVRVSRSLRDIAYKALQAKEAYILQHFIEPTIEQLSALIDVKKEILVFALDAIQDPISLHEPMNGDATESISMLDQLKSNDSEEDWVTFLSLKNSMQQLSKRQRTIISKRFYLGETQTEIARNLGLSQAQISRIEKTALQQIQKLYS